MCLCVFRALDRLDAAEEMQLKEELKRLDARVAQAEADNATIEENLSHLDGASKVGGLMPSSLPHHLLAFEAAHPRDASRLSSRCRSF